MESWGLRAWSSGLHVKDLGIRPQGLHCGVPSIEFRVQRLEFRV